MLNKDFFLRVLIAVIGFVALILAIPALLKIVGLPVDDNVLLIIKLAIAALAVSFVASKK